MKFKKSLAKYYKKWYDDCLNSERLCMQNKDYLRAESYRTTAEEYRKIILENYEAIEFFSIKDNAFIKDSALPEKFRGYE